MQYTKRFMRRSELIKEGFPEETLNDAYRSQGTHLIAWKTTNAKNAPIVFDTEELQRYLMRRNRREVRA